MITDKNEIAVTQQDSHLADSSTVNYEKCLRTVQVNNTKQLGCGRSLWFDLCERLDSLKCHKQVH